MRLFFILLVFLSTVIGAFPLNLEGVVKDAATGEALIGANLYLKNNPSVGTTTGFDGKFILQGLKQGKVTLVCSYIIYQTIERQIDMLSGSKTKIELELVSYETELSDVVVIAGAKISDLAVRNMERLSSNVMNIVGAKSIEISPDLRCQLQRVETLECSSFKSALAFVLLQQHCREFGWRRPSVKGGSIWLEDNIIAELYNNLLVDVRWPAKRYNMKMPNAACVITPNYYFSSTATGIEQIKADSASGRIIGANDVLSMTAGDKNPNFKNFTQQSNVNLNAGPTGEGIPVAFNTSWDFHLNAGSLAATGGKTNFTRHWGTTGLTLDGVEYKSPAPSAYFGAFAVK